MPSFHLPAAEDAADVGADGADAPVIAKKYDKSKSFFDDLSTDENDAHSRQKMYQQRRVDAETFGDVAKHYRSMHSRGGFRGGFNRGRGGYRGRGRGGAHQQF